eukprot:TRINITY_DN3801_c0_g1_i1.p1 TRINITY_DN3801_c0_g1~~TRINITY_DN3801_c0_g1_i1.p1  ORF type:complete len:344 (-),score=42.40 TRINITY_DN3801_c0_g1_i1:129-1037(-)
MTSQIPFTYKNTTLSPHFIHMLDNMLKVYWNKNPTSLKALDFTRKLQKTRKDIPLDHVAFRTFGSQGLGVDSLAPLFMHQGYCIGGTLEFPVKKLRATWYAPPTEFYDYLPRVFISELKVEELSNEAQDIILRNISTVRSLDTKQVGECAATGKLPWDVPTWEDFKKLNEESEYGAWTLTNGYAVNHATISVHNLDGLEGGIHQLNELLLKEGFELNQSGGMVKESPDGGLLQSSTMADKTMFEFKDGESREIVGSYIEFAERIVLKKFMDLERDGKAKEIHRRDGFEATSADKIFESTFTQ